MRTTLLILLSLAISLKGNSQQDPLYSQYLMNPFVLNPAYAGFTKSMSASASFRKQWAGFDGSPVTFNATAHTSLIDNKMGLGLLIIQDNIGSDKTSEIQGVYAYHLQLTSGARISFGLQGGMINYRSDFSELNINTSDPRFQNNISEMKPTIGSGIIFSSDKFFVGISVPRMLKQTTGIEDKAVQIYNQHLYATAAYVTNLGYRIKLKPFLLARAVQGSDVSVDFGMAVNADNSYTLGLFTRNLHTYGFLASIELGDHLRVGYVFELPTDKSVGLNFTSHELTLGVRLKWFSYHNLGTITDF